MNFTQIQCDFALTHCACFHLATLVLLCSSLNPWLMTHETLEVEGVTSADVPLHRMFARKYT